MKYAFWETQGESESAVCEEKVNYQRFKRVHRKFGCKTVNCVGDAIFILLQSNSYLYLAKRLNLIKYFLHLLQRTLYHVQALFVEKAIEEILAIEGATCTLLVALQVSVESYLYPDFLNSCL